MFGACFASVSDFFYWSDLAAFNLRCLAHVLPMFLIFSTGAALAAIQSAKFGRRFCKVFPIFFYWSQPGRIKIRNVRGKDWQLFS